MAAAREIVHGTAIALAGRAALIRGPSGCGKSDLALRCLSHAPFADVAAPALLVADDQVEVERTGDALLVRAPATIRGKLEVRGLGIIEFPCAPRAELALVVDLVAPRSVPRMPDPVPTVLLLGRHVPLLQLSAFEHATPTKVLLALARGTGAADQP